MLTLPRISVITVVRNSVATLPRAIESVIAQNYPDLEYIVLDAASTDGTVDVIHRFNDHISFWRSEKDDGPTAAYNEGINRATGSIVAFLNADDWYEPGILRDIGEAFAQDHALDIVSCMPRIVKEKDGAFVDSHRFNPRRMLVDFGAYPVPNARFFRKELFVKHGNFIDRDADGHILLVSDLEFLFRIALAKPKQLLLPRVGYTYLAHDRSFTYSDNAENKRRMYRQRAFIAQRHLPQMGGYPKEARALVRRWFRRATTREFFWQWQAGDKTRAKGIMKRGLDVCGPLWLLDAARVGVLKKYRI